MWPRLIIGVTQDPDQVSVQVTFDRTGTFMSERRACPTELDAARFRCSFATAAAPADTTARIVVLDRDEAPISENTVALGPFSYCGHDIAYVEFTPGSGAGTWSDVRYISPCSGY
jgi:hypothetical protein